MRWARLTRNTLLMRDLRGHVLKRHEFSRRIPEGTIASLVVSAFSIRNYTGLRTANHLHLGRSHVSRHGPIGLEFPRVWDTSLRRQCKVDVNNLGPCILITVYGAPLLSCSCSRE